MWFTFSLLRLRQTRPCSKIISNFWSCMSSSGTAFNGLRVEVGGCSWDDCPAIKFSVVIFLVLLFIDIVALSSVASISGAVVSG
jgi:hypothetical protein